MSWEKLTSEIERVVRPNQEFRLDALVSVNIVSVKMSRWEAGKKRREINLDKYLTNKR